MMVDLRMCDVIKMINTLIYFQKQKRSIFFLGLMLLMR